MKGLVLAAALALPAGISSFGTPTSGQLRSCVDPLAHCTDASKLNQNHLSQVKITGFSCENHTRKALFFNIYSGSEEIYRGLAPAYQTVPGDTHSEARFFEPLLVRNPRFHQDRGMDCDIGIKLQDLPQR